jgi:uncharacterized repeat protein (TIGR03803 family)
MSSFKQIARFTKHLLLALLIGLAASPQAATAAPQTPLYDVRYSFTGTQQDEYPQTGVIRASDGNYYGIADQALFRLGSDGSYTVIHQFTADEGAGLSPLIQASDGYLYGGSARTLYRAGLDGTVSVLYQASANSDPSYFTSALVEGAGGVLYGTSGGGGAYGFGTVFRWSPSDGTLTTLYSFNGNATFGAFSGVSANGLAWGPDGLLYGSTVYSASGQQGGGTLFRMRTDGTLDWYYYLQSADGANPLGSLTLASDGTLYGTAKNGGANGKGTVFQLVPNPLAIKTVYAFAAADGGYPQYGVVQGPNGNLFGTTQYGPPGSACPQCGAVFRVGLTGLYLTLHAFDASTGNAPWGKLFSSSDGWLYGTAEIGSANHLGAVYRIHPNNALVGYWKGDGNTADAAGSNDGTPVGNVAYTKGRVGKKAFLFDGQSYVDVPGVGKYQFGQGDFSLAFWVRIDVSINDGSAFVSKDNYDGGSTYSGWLFNRSDELGGYGFEVRQMPAERDQARVKKMSGKWHHLVGVREGHTMSLYIDGVLAKQTVTSLVSDVSNDADLRIGALSDASPQMLQGAVDDVQLYSRALQAGEIKALAAEDGF